MDHKEWKGWNIFDAYRYSRLDVLRVLIEEYREDPNAIDSEDHRPLDYAIAGNFPDVRAYLESPGHSRTLLLGRLGPLGCRVRIFNNMARLSDRRKSFRSQGNSGIGF